MELTFCFRCLLHYAVILMEQKEFEEKKTIIRKKES